MILLSLMTGSAVLVLAGLLFAPDWVRLTVAGVAAFLMLVGVVCSFRDARRTTSKVRRSGGGFR